MKFDMRNITIIEALLASIGLSLIIAWRFYFYEPSLNEITGLMTGIYVFSWPLFSEEISD
jgi:hypothetical protein